MKRLMEKTVFCGLVTAWRLATVPTSRSPPCVKATTEGVVRPPSAFSITVGSPPSSTAMAELVVPRSIPMVFAMCCVLPCGRKKSESDYGRFHSSDKGREPRGLTAITSSLRPARAVKAGRCDHVFLCVPTVDGDYRDAETLRAGGGRS